MFARRRREKSAPDTATTSAWDTSAREGENQSGSTRSKLSRLTAAGMVVTIAMLAALAGLGYAIYDYVDARNTVSVADDRDSALQGAEQAMLNVTNINPGDVDGFRKRAASTLIGDVTEQLSQSGLDQLAKAGPNAGTLTSTVARSGLTEFDHGSHTGKALVYVNVTAQRPNQASTSQTMGFLVAVQRDGGIYKAKTITSLDGYDTTPTDDSGSGSSTGATPASPAPATSDSTQGDTTQGDTTQGDTTGGGN